MQPTIQAIDDDEDFGFIPLTAKKLTGMFEHQAWVIFSYHPRSRMDQQLNGDRKHGSIVAVMEAECMGPLDRTTVLLIARNGPDMRERNEGLFLQAVALVTGAEPRLSSLHKHEFNGRNQMLDAFREAVPQFGEQIAVRRSPLEVEDVLQLESWDYAREIGGSLRPLRTWHFIRNADVQLKT